MKRYHNLSVVNNYVQPKLNLERVMNLLVMCMYTKSKVEFLEACRGLYQVRIIINGWPLLLLGLQVVNNLLAFIGSV